MLRSGRLNAGLQFFVYSMFFVMLVVFGGRQILGVFYLNLTAVKVTKIVLAQTEAPDLARQGFEVSDFDHEYVVDFTIPGLHYLKGLGFNRVGNKVSALKEFETAAAQGHQLAYYQLGLQFMKQENWQEAFLSFKKASCQCYLFAWKVADSKVEQKDFDTALVILDSYLSAYPNSAEAYYHIANIYQSRGQTEAMIAPLEAALEYDPDQISTSHRYQLARLAFLKKDYILAENILEELVGLGADDYQLLALLGRTYLVQSKFDEAVQILVAATQINVDYPYTYAYIGDAYINLNRFSEAAAYYKEAYIRSNESTHLSKYIKALSALGQTCQEEYLRGILDQISKGISVDPSATLDEAEITCRGN